MGLAHSHPTPQLQSLDLRQPEPIVRLARDFRPDLILHTVGLTDVDLCDRDLEKALDAYPIRELATPEQKDRICRSLRRGNLQLVTFRHANGSWQSNMIYVNPEKQLICNVGEATSADRQLKPTVPVTQLLEFDKADDDEISEKAPEEEAVRRRKKVVL